MGTLTFKIFCRSLKKISALWNAQRVVLGVMLAILQSSGIRAMEGGGQPEGGSPQTGQVEARRGILQKKGGAKRDAPMSVDGLFDKFWTTELDRQANPHSPQSGKGGTRQFPQDEEKREVVDSKEQNMPLKTSGFWGSNEGGDGEVSSAAIASDLTSTRVRIVLNPQGVSAKRRCVEPCVMPGGAMGGGLSLKTPVFRPVQLKDGRSAHGMTFSSEEAFQNWRWANNWINKQNDKSGTGHKTTELDSSGLMSGVAFSRSFAQAVPLGMKGLGGPKGAGECGLSAGDGARSAAGGPIVYLISPEQEKDCAEQDLVVQEMDIEKAVHFLDGIKSKKSSLETLRRDLQMACLYAQGMGTYTDLGKQFNLSSQVVGIHIRKIGILLSGTQWNWLSVYLEEKAAMNKNSGTPPYQLRIRLIDEVSAQEGSKSAVGAQMGAQSIPEGLEAAQAGISGRQSAESLLGVAPSVPNSMAVKTPDEGSWQ